MIFIGLGLKVTENAAGYERSSTLITSNLPFEEWTETLGSERLTGALLDRLTHHVSILVRRDKQDETSASIRMRRGSAAWNGGRA